MSTCQLCEQEMNDGVGCTWRAIVEIDPLGRGPELEGRLYERIPYRAKRRSQPCGDCHTPAGALHHPGCDLEKCPACRRQAISCGCRWEGEAWIAPEHADEEED